MKTNQILPKAIVLFVGIPAVFAVVVLSVIYYGWALHLLWNWFFVPILGAPVITIGEAIGLSLVVSLFKGSFSASGDDDNEKYADLIIPLVCVFAGLIVKAIIF